MADAQAILDIHSSVVGELIAFIQDVNAGSFDEAEAALARSEDAFARTSSRFERIATRTSRPEVLALHELLGQARAIQQELFAVGETLLEVGRELEADGSEDTFGNALAEWDGIIRRQRRNVSDIDKLVAELESQLPQLES